MNKIETEMNETERERWRIGIERMVKMKKRNREKAEEG